VTLYPRDVLRAHYDTLAVRYRERFQTDPPPWPANADLNVLANLNRQLLGEILGRPQVQVTMRDRPVVFPLKEPKDDGG